MQILESTYFGKYHFEVAMVLRESLLLFSILLNYEAWVNYTNKDVYVIVYSKKIFIQNTNLNDEDILIKKITTKGDQVQNQRLSEVGGKGLFSSNIEKELLDKKIDIAVHALKDMPAIETHGLTTDTFLERNDPREILITKDKKKIKDLHPEAIIGTSSYRREFQIKKIRSDLNCKLIRGNVDTRIKKLNDGLYDAIILSYAGIKSLSVENKITEVFSTEEIIPSAGQGIISLQCRNNDKEVISILDRINDQETSLRAHTERKKTHTNISLRENGSNDSAAI